jgi:hypothetical protein
MMARRMLFALESHFHWPDSRTVMLDQDLSIEVLNSSGVAPPGQAMGSPAPEGLNNRCPADDRRFNVNSY